MIQHPSRPFVTQAGTAWQHPCSNFKAPVAVTSRSGRFSGCCSDQHVRVRVTVLQALDLSSGSEPPADRATVASPGRRRTAGRPVSTFGASPPASPDPVGILEPVRTLDRTSLWPRRLRDGEMGVSASTEHHETLPDSLGNHRALALLSATLFKFRGPGRAESLSTFLRLDHAVQATLPCSFDSESALPL